MHVVKVVVADTNVAPHHELLAQSLPAGAALVVCTQDDEDEILREIVDADVFVGSRFTARMGQAARALRLVHVAGAGYDGIDLPSLPRGASCAVTFHHEESIAEYIVASLVLLKRNMLKVDTALRQGRWLSPAYSTDALQPRTLKGSVATFLGFGHIGVAAWRALRPFGVSGIAITRSGEGKASELGLLWSANLKRLSDALAESDILIISVPLSETTIGLIAAPELELLGGTGLLVNVARGPVVDEEALYSALKRQVLGGAALDVWYTYPAVNGQADPSRFPFGDLDNVVMTPHSSGATVDTFQARVKDIAHNVGRLERGESLLNLVAVGSSRGNAR
jgi:phosphoglycerate dehydrogenase-like enzyme